MSKPVQDWEATSAKSSTHLASPSRFPKNRYEPTLNRVLPSVAGDRLPHRLRSIASFKELARKTSQSILNPSFLNRQSISGSNNEKDLSHRHASLTHLPGSPDGPRCRPPTLATNTSTHSSFESLTPDTSGISNNSTQPSTPGIFKAPSSLLLRSEESLDQDMGNTASIVIRKPLSTRLRKERSILNLDHDQSETPTPSPEQAKDNTKGPPPVLRHRASSIQHPIPRRRSSLTALHLDSSHFETPVSSKLSQLTVRASSFSESFRPRNMSSVMITPSATATQSLRGDTLSPSMLSPQLSKSKVSLASSNTQSPSTPAPPHIHLPPTFPDGPIETPTPPLTMTHYSCYQGHRRMQRNPYKCHPVPCTACSVADNGMRWKCVWCALRICDGCMAQLAANGRDLEKLMDSLAKEKEKGNQRSIEALEQPEQPEGSMVPEEKPKANVGSTFKLFPGREEVLQENRAKASIDSSLQIANGKVSWGRARAEKLLRDSRG